MKYGVYCKCGQLTIRSMSMDYSECFDCKKERHRKAANKNYYKNKLIKVTKRQKFMKDISNG